MNRKILLPIAFLLMSLLAVSQTITVDLNKELQTIEGFGGFGPKKVWWNAGPWFDQEYLNQTMDNLGVLFFRTQIYWDGEPANDNEDSNTFNWDGFDFGPESDNGKQYPFLKAVDDRGGKILATVWTPPLWMKLYDDPDRRPDPLPDWCGDCDQVGGYTNPEHYDEFAEYLVAYVKTVKEEIGVDIHAISIQNEPLFANPFESNVVKPDEYAEILKVVGKRFQEEELTTLLFGPEHMGEYFWRPGNIDYVREILEDTVARQYLDFYAVHSYKDAVSPDYGSAEGWTKLHNNITVAHGKQLWMTETSDFNKIGFDLGFSMAKSLYLALKFGRISGWVYWYMADYVIKDNKLTSLGYAFKNFCRYIKPGSIHVESASSDSGILATAFKNGSNITLVLINNTSVEKIIDLDFLNGTGHEIWAVYRTSASDNCRLAGIDTNDSIELPAQSITTLTDGSDVTGFNERNETLPLNMKVYSGRNKLKLFYKNSAFRQGTFRIYDLQGILLKEYDLPLYKGEHTFEYTFDGQGLFIATITTKRTVFHRKFISY